MAVRILFAGDANVDIVCSGLEAELQLDREVFCSGYLATLGGSSTLTAAAYAHLGGRCDFCGLVGEDEGGRLVAASLAAAGVGLGLLRGAAGLRTGVTLSIVRGSTRSQVTYRGCLAEVDETERILGALEGYGHLHISGAYGTPRFLPRVAEVLAAARAAGLGTSLDTQWDPTETWSEVEAWLPRLSWLFVNEDEARSIARRLGLPGAGGEVGRLWEGLAGLTARPVIKLGPRGAFAAGRLSPAFALPAVVDSTGAGDSFAAAFLYASLEEGAGDQAALRFAQAAGALACGYEGGYSPLLSRGRLAELLDAGSANAPSGGAGGA